MMNNLFDGQTIELESELRSLPYYRKLKYKKVSPLSYILNRKQKLQMSNKQLATRIEASESLVSKILKGERMTRDNLIKICIVLRFQLAEINQLMRYFGYPSLYVKNERDQIILYGIHNKTSIKSINADLKANGIKQLL